MNELDEFYQKANSFPLNERIILDFYSKLEIIKSWNHIYDFISSIGYVVSSQIVFVRNRKALNYMQLRTLSLIMNDIIKPIKGEWENTTSDELQNYIKEQFSSLYSVSRTKKMIQNFFPIEVINKEGIIIKN